MRARARVCVCVCSSCVLGDVATPRQHSLVRRCSGDGGSVRLGVRLQAVLRRRPSLHGRRRRHAPAPGALLHVLVAGRRALPCAHARRQSVRTGLARELHSRYICVITHSSINQLHTHTHTHTHTHRRLTAVCSDSELLQD